MPIKLLWVERRNPLNFFLRVFGGPGVIPMYILRMLFTSRLGNFHRTVLTAFVFGNAMHIRILMDALLFVNPYAAKRRLSKIYYLADSWVHSEDARSRRWYYDVRTRSVRSLNDVLWVQLVNPRRHVRFFSAGYDTFLSERDVSTYIDVFGFQDKVWCYRSLMPGE
jgi:hypothetical protein